MIPPEQQAQLIALDDAVESPFCLVRYNVPARRFEILVQAQPNPLPGIALIDDRLLAQGLVPTWAIYYRSVTTTGTN